MARMRDLAEVLERRRHEALEIDGAERLARQHGRGRRTAGERVTRALERSAGKVVERPWRERGVAPV